MSMNVKVSKAVLLVVLLQLCAVADFPLSIFYSSLYAQGIPLIRNYTAAESVRMVRCL